MNKKILHAAVLVAIAAATPADAVHINPDGLGQVLIFPYYTVRAGQFTAVLFANTQNNTKAVKVRFLEGKNGREAIDFNLFLGPTDVWTGAVVATADGARIISNDNSCVSPSDLFAETRTDGLGRLMNAFKNYQYSFAWEDNVAFSTLDRTREGYIEVIEMGVIDDDLVTGNAMTAGNTAPVVTAYIKHNSAGVPANCGALDSFDSWLGNPSKIQFPNTGSVGSLMQPPRGGLSGRASIINSATGANYTFSPTALDAWSATVQYAEAGSPLPSLSAANPPVSNVLIGDGVITATWATGRDAVSAALMRNTIQNEFVLDAGTQSQTDWIVTFPTKRNYVAVGDGAAPITARPFTSNFHNNQNDGSCDPYSDSMWNREELVPAKGTNNLPVGNPVAPARIPSLCWAASVIPLTISSLLESTNTSLLIAPSQTFVSGATSVAIAPATPSLRGTQGPNGWLVMNFDKDAQLLRPVSAVLTIGGVPAPVPLGYGRHNGMPVIGAMVHNYRNTGVASLYGSVVEHRFTRSIN